MAEQSELQAKVGHVINDRYKIIRCLGLGAVGIVYLAEDQDLGGLQVALKLLYQHLLVNSVSVERFRSEVRIARQLHHPNLVTIHDFGRTSENQYFIVMEYIRGTTLAEVLKTTPDNRLSLPAAISTLYEIASGMGHAHQHSVIHRDLKPQNILIGEGGRIAVCDFGMARQLDSVDGLTRTGESIGTPYYMAPELFRGQTADERTDVYAIGIIAYELITGTRPFTDEVFYALALKHVEAPMPAVPTSLHVPAWLQEFIARATAKEKEQRFASAFVIAELLEKHLDANTRQRKDLLFQNWKEHEGRRIALERRKRRKLVRQLLLLAAFVALLVTAGFSRFNTRQRWGIGVPIMIIEKYLGPTALWPLKRMFGIDFNFDPQDLRDVVYAHIIDAPDVSPDEFKFRDARIRTLLDAGIDPNTTDDRGVALGLLLAEKGHDDVASYFLQSKDFNPNVRNAAGVPLLHILVMTRRQKLLDLLAQNSKLDVSIRDGKGQTILHLALNLKDLHFLSAFLLHAQWNKELLTRIPDSAGNTPLAVAILEKSLPLDLLTALIRSSDTNHTGPRGKTALVLAAENDYPEAIVPLVKDGHARLDIRDGDGKSALYYASRLPSDECLNQFLKIWWAESLYEQLADIREDRRGPFRELMEKEWARDQERRNAELRSSTSSAEAP